MGPFPRGELALECVCPGRTLITSHIAWKSMPKTRKQITVANKLLEKPDHLHSYQERQLESNVMANGSTVTEDTHITPYHPQSDCMVELFNCTVLSTLV